MSEVFRSVRFVASLHAQVCDLLGYDPDEPDPVADRPAVAEAVRGCPRGAVRPARDAAGRAVAVVRLSTGEVCVVSDRCPHDGGTLSDGFVEADRLVCARHLRVFDVRRPCS